MLTFVCNKKKSQYLLAKIKPIWKDDIISSYYKYANDIKPRPGSYINFLGLLNTWNM
jgi:hypothetical protein